MLVPALMVVDREQRGIQPATAGLTLSRYAWLWPLLALFVLQYALFMNLSAPQWDAISYYAVGRSIAFDADLHLANDYVLAYERSAPEFVAKNAHEELTASGRVYIPFAIGSGLVWLPLIVLLRLSALATVGAISGYEVWFSGTVSAFSALLGLAAFVLAAQMAATFAGRKLSVASAALFMFATPLLYYQFREPLYAHATTALLTTAAIASWWWQRSSRPSLGGGLLTGALIGLSALSRWQNVIYLALPAGWALLWWLSLPAQQRRKGLTTAAVYLAATSSAILLFLSPQLAFWKLFYGTWFTVPQGEAFITWRAEYLGPYLFSPFRGLFAWMPLLLPALAGLLWLCIRRPLTGVPLLLIVLAQTFVNSSLPDWFAGGGYGPRRASGEIAIYVIGLAYLWHQLAHRVQWRNLLHLLFVLTGLLLVAQQLILLQFGLAEQIGGRITVFAPPNFDWAESSWPQFLQALWSHAPLVHHQPAAFASIDTFAGRLLAGDGFVWSFWLPLLPALLYALLVAAAVVVMMRLLQRSPRSRVLLASGLLLLLLSFNLWILRLA